MSWGMPFLFFEHGVLPERRKKMRQKYVINRDVVKEKLNIKEYAIIDKNIKKVDSSVLQQGSFVFLCEETYESEIIKSSIAKGLKTLVASLRTHNLFPIEPYITKIAESVMGLYTSSDDGSVELFFDDVDLVLA